MITREQLHLIHTIQRTLRERYGRLSITITDHDHSPWILVSILRVDSHDSIEPHEWHLGVWRTTDDLYRIIESAADDDPIQVDDLIPDG